jgi:hypothetical protein
MRRPDRLFPLIRHSFRDKLQSMGAVEFTQRGHAQAEAEGHIKRKLADHAVETRGVCIQDVVLPGRGVGQR